MGITRLKFAFGDGRALAVHRLNTISSRRDGDRRPQPPTPYAAANLNQTAKKNMKIDTGRGRPPDGDRHYHPSTPHPSVNRACPTVMYTVARRGLGCQVHAQLPRYACTSGNQSINQLNPSTHAVIRPETHH